MRSSFVRSCVLGALAAIVLAACGGGGDDEAAQDDREQPQAIQRHDLSCSGCAFGPRTYVRQRGLPRPEFVELKGDDSVDYLLTITEAAGLGDFSVVALDGKVVFAPEIQRGTRHVAINVKLKPRSYLSILQLGRPGSTLTVMLQSGAKRVGPEGGAVAAPGGVSLSIPPGALATAQQITVRPYALDVPERIMGAVELGPDGLTFAQPVTLAFGVSSAMLGGRTGHRLRVTSLVGAGPSAGWQELPSSFNPSTLLLTTQLAHFSVYAFAWAHPGCHTSGDAAYDALMRQLAQRIFRLAAPPDPSNTTGCITQGYLQEGYSEHFAGMEHHAGVDFDAAAATPAYALHDGVVESVRLNADVQPGKSTLVIRSTIRGREYRLLYLHCRSMEHYRGVGSGRQDLGDLVRDRQVLAGDEVCQTGDVGAPGEFHLHLEAKEVGMDEAPSSCLIDPTDGICLVGPLTAIAPGHCSGGRFTNWEGVEVSGCQLSYIEGNTVDPVLLLTDGGSSAFVDNFNRADGTTVGNGWIEESYFINANNVNQIDAVSILGNRLRISHGATGANVDAGVYRPYARTCGSTVAGNVEWPTNLASAAGLSLNARQAGAQGGLQLVLAPALNNPHYIYVYHEGVQTREPVPFTFEIGVLYQFEWRVAQDCSTEVRVWRRDQARPTNPTTTSPAVVPTQRANPMFAVFAYGGSGCCAYPGYDVRFDDVSLTEGLGYTPTLSVSPVIVPIGGSTTLTWSTGGAPVSACSLSRGPTPLPVLDAPSGSYVATNIQGRTTFTITCGGTSASRTVEIIPIIGGG